MADFIYFKYNAQAKPVLSDRDGEVNTNWNNVGNTTITADSDYAHTGTKSFKVSASGTGDLTDNYAVLASGNNATFAVASKYVIAIWLRSAYANSVKIQTGGVASGTISYSSADVTTGWVCRFFTFTASTATTDVRIAVTTTGGGAIWFELEAFYEGDAFPVLIEKGLVKPEKFSLYPQIINEYLDGSKETQFKAFIRSLNLQTNTLTTSQMLTYLYWTFKDNLGTVDYDIDNKQETGLKLIPDVEQEFQWRFDLKLAPYLEVNLGEGVARTIFP